MKKLGLITSVSLWIDMRDVRDRIVHNYLPEKSKVVYDLIMNPYAQGLNHLLDKLDRLETK